MKTNGGEEKTVKRKVRGGNERESSVYTRRLAPWQKPPADQLKM